MERLTPEGADTELLYEELRQRLEYGNDSSIEWWQVVFQDLQDAKQYLTDQKLVAEIDALISEYGDLTRYIRKDQKSMQAAFRVTNVIIKKVMEAISRH